jgi:hypothetical protein
LSPGASPPPVRTAIRLRSAMAESFLDSPGINYRPLLFPGKVTCVEI